MHIEPGVVSGAKIALSYGTAAVAGGYLVKLCMQSCRESGFAALAQRSFLACLAVFASFEILPHYPVGPSEVHFIFGSTLFLIFGAAAAGVGLMLGLLAQGLLFEPQDLPQYAMNVTTLIAPLLLAQDMARRIVAPKTPYVDLTYRQTLALSSLYQAGVVGWVAFWVIYGQGFSLAALSSLATFGASYAIIVAIEPVLDLGLLALAKTARGLKESRLVDARLFRA